MAWLSSDGVGQAFKEVLSNPQEILHPGGIQEPLGAHGMKSAQGNPGWEDPEVHRQRHCDPIYPPDSNRTLFMLNYTSIIIFVNASEVLPLTALNSRSEILKISLIASVLRLFN